MDKFLSEEIQDLPLENKESPAEKPVSLWGASFFDVVKALLETKPMPKEEKGNNGKEKGETREN